MLYPHCRIASGQCQLLPAAQCVVCKDWPKEKWTTLRRRLIDAKSKSSKTGAAHWTDGVSTSENGSRGGPSSQGLAVLDHFLQVSPRPQVLPPP